MPEKDPIQTNSNIDDAWIAAVESNNSFSNLIAIEQQVILSEAMFERCNTDLKIREDIRDKLAAEHEKAETSFKHYQDLAGLVMGQPISGDPEGSQWSQTEAIIAGDEEEIDEVKFEIPQNPLVESLLSPEQKKFAIKVIDSMSEDLWIKKENIRLVLEESVENGRRIVAIDGNQSGPYTGSFNQIEMFNGFTINIDGVNIDTLENVTTTSYQAMIADAKARGVNPLPDNNTADLIPKNSYTKTILTGEPLTSAGKVYVHNLHAGVVERSVVDRDNDHFSLRVRPTVVIANLSNEEQE